jgi:hypothetical protein
MSGMKRKAVGNNVGEFSGLADLLLEVMLAWKFMEIVFSCCF